MIDNVAHRAGLDGTPTDIKTYPDFEVSWAGPGRTPMEFCLGSEDGRIRITDEGLNPIADVKDSPLRSAEAINGVAFLNDLMALSTRCEVVILTQQAVNGKGSRAVFPAGAHGAIATASGHVVAPLGRGGIMVVKSSGNENQPVVVSKASHKTVDFYKLVSIRCTDGEVLVGAARQDGVVALPFPSGGARLISSLTYPGLDVVDVCALAQDRRTASIAALSRDCTLILSRDALHDRRPVTVKFDDINGTAYRILNSDGNLLLLTGRALYVLAGLGRRFLENEPVGQQATPVKQIVLEAADANIAGERSLLIVMPDGVCRVDLEALVGAVPSNEDRNGLQEIRPIGMSPTWQPRQNDLQSENRVMAGVV